MGQTASRAMSHVVMHATSSSYHVQLRQQPACHVHCRENGILKIIAH